MKTKSAEAERQRQRELEREKGSVLFFLCIIIRLSYLFRVTETGGRGEKAKS